MTGVQTCALPISAGQSGMGVGLFSTTSYLPQYVETRSFISVGAGVAIGEHFLIRKRISVEINIGAKWLPYPPWIPKSKTINGIKYDLVTEKFERNGIFTRNHDSWGWRGTEGAPGNLLFLHWALGYAF